MAERLPALHSSLTQGCIKSNTTAVQLFPARTAPEATTAGLLQPATLETARDMNQALEARTSPDR